MITSNTHTLRNKSLEITVSTFGGELISVKNVHGTEFIWQADPNVWKRHAPILFPYVGKLHNDTIRLNGKEYTGFFQHGFARDHEFKLQKTSDESLTLILNSKDIETNFPVDFELRVMYSLRVDSVIVTFEVANIDKHILPFSLGYHPAFRCPVVKDTKFEDYLISMETAQTLERTYLHSGYLGKKIVFMEDVDSIPLSKALFEDDALIFDNVSSNTVGLVTKYGDTIVQISGILDWPYLGIWTKLEENAQFICIEPWQGIADSEEDKELEFTKKPGIVLLRPRKSWHNQISMQFNADLK